MQLSVLLAATFSATTLALPAASRACKLFATISDPGFYTSASIPSASFPDDDPSFENQVLQFQPTVTSASSCRLVARFKKGFPITTSGPGDLDLDAYIRPTYDTRTYVGSIGALPVGPAGTLTRDVSNTIGIVPCGSDVVFEFQLALSTPGDWASVAFANDAANGFFVSVC